MSRRSIRRSWRNTRGRERALAPAELRALLQGLDVRHVLLHGEYLRADQLADARGRLAAALGSPGVAWGEVIAFDVPAALANVSWVAQFDDALSLQVLAIDRGRRRANRRSSLARIWHP